MFKQSQTREIEKHIKAIKNYLTKYSNANVDKHLSLMLQEYKTYADTVKKMIELEKKIKNEISLLYQNIIKNEGDKNA